MISAWKSLAERIDALTARERGIVFVLTLCVMLFAWHTFLYQPLDARRGRLEDRVSGLREGIATLNGQIAEMVAVRSADPDADARAQLAGLRNDAAGMRDALVTVVAQLVPPREMAQVLEAVLTRETGLRLVRLEGLGAELVMGPPDEPAEEAASRDPEPGRGPARRLDFNDLLDRPIALFRHGLRIELEGGYLDTLGYLEALEALSWRFIWDSVTVEVVDHPTARVEITVFSMSMEDEWIGV